MGLKIVISVEVAISYGVVVIAKLYVVTVVDEVLKVADFSLVLCADVINLVLIAYT